MSNLERTQMDNIEQYIAIIKELGASNSNISKRRHFLTTLCRALDGKQKNKGIYDYILNNQLERFNLGETKFLYEVTGREFFPFWKDDQDSINRMLRDGRFLVNPIKIIVNGNVQDIVRTIKKGAKFEKPGLELYLKNIYEKDKNQTLLNKRNVWLNILLWILKDVEKTNDGYRAAVNACVMLFDDYPSQEFFDTIRGYFVYWQNFYQNK